LSTDLLLYKQQSAYLIFGGHTTLTQNLMVTSNSTNDKNQRRKNNQLYRPTMMVENVVDCGILTGLTGNCSSSWSVRVLFLTVLSLLRYFGSEKGMVGKPLFVRCHQRDDNDAVDCCVAVRFAP
jgi:hypothetical protein